MAKPSLRKPKTVAPSQFALCLLATAALLSSGPRPHAQEGEGPPPDPPIVGTLIEHHEADPRNPVPIYTLARVMDQLNRPSEAIEWLQTLDLADWNGQLEKKDFPKTAEHEDFAPLAERFDARAMRRSYATVAFEVAIPDLAPEGTAWDSKRKELLLSSGHFRKVVAINPEGRVRDVIKEGQDGVLAVLGMEVDTQGRLWVASAAAPFMRGFTPELAGTGAVHAFDLETGSTVGSWFVAEKPALANDLTVAANGHVFLTESQGSRVLGLDPDSGNWTEMPMPGDALGPNGIALNGAGDRLFVTDFVGLIAIDLKASTTERLSPPSGVASLGGIDGLAYDSGSLWAIQNVLGRGRVWRLALDPAEHQVVHAELLEAGRASFRNPTTGAVTDRGYMFLANPQIQAAGSEGLEPLPEGGRFEVLLIDDPAKDPELQSLRATSDAWWRAWLPAQTADLATAIELEAEATGFGYFGEDLRSIKDPEARETRLRAWLDTLASLDFYPIERSFERIGNTGLERGLYYERQIRKEDGVVRREHRGRYTMTWINSEGQWRIASYHRSAITERP